VGSIQVGITLGVGTLARISRIDQGLMRIINMSEYILEK
jgi:hypothetical protein